MSPKDLRLAAATLEGVNRGRLLERADVRVRSPTRLALDITEGAHVQRKPDP